MSQSDKETVIPASFILKIKERNLVKINELKEVNQDSTTLRSIIELQDQNSFIDFILSWFTK